nr:hypothetical protein [Chitinophagaceae bacterium]
MKKLLSPLILLCLTFNVIAQKSLCDSVFTKVGNVFSTKNYRLTINTVNQALKVCSDTVYGQPNFWKHQYLLSYKAMAHTFLNEHDSA